MEKLRYSNYIIDQVDSIYYIYPLMVIIFTAVYRAQVIETFFHNSQILNTDHATNNGFGESLPLILLSSINGRLCHQDLYVSLIKDRDNMDFTGQFKCDLYLSLMKA